MKTYLKRFNKMVDELKRNPQIEITEFEINPPATDDEFEVAAEKFELTEDIVDFYQQANGIILKWRKIDDEDGFVTGKIELLPVQDAFGDWSETFETEDFPELEPLHPIDFYTNEACAGLYLDGSKNPKIYSHKLGDEVENIDLDFKEYLDLLLITRGFFYWQDAIISFKNDEKRFAETNLRNNLPLLFSDVNIDEILK